VIGSGLEISFSIFFSRPDPMNLERKVEEIFLKRYGYLSRIKI